MFHSARAILMRDGVTPPPAEAGGVVPNFAPSIPPVAEATGVPAKFMREKSHYCIARYLEAKYADRGLLEPLWVQRLDQYRDLRHADQYDTGFHATKDEAKEALKIATEFLDRMKELVETKNGKA